MPSRAESRPLTDAFSRSGTDPVRLLHPDPPAVETRTFEAALPQRWFRLEIAYPPDGLADVVISLRFADGGVAVRRPPTLDRNAFGELLYPQAPLKGFDLHLRGSADLERPSRLRFGSGAFLARASGLARRVWRVLQEDPRSFVGRAIQFSYRSRHQEVMFAPLADADPNLSEAQAYAGWIARFDEDPLRHRARHEARLAGLAERPLISVLTDLRGGEGLERLVSDLAAQIYPDWELVLPDEAPAPEGLPAARVRRVPSRQGRAARLGEGLRAAAGEFVLPARPGVRLRPHALLELALTTRAVPTADWIYADEDGIDPAGERRSPRFKPAWSPDLLRSHDYVGDPSLFRTRALRAIGGWRDEVAPAEDHDLKLRLAETLPARAIVHLAKVLVHREGPEPSPGRVGHQVVAEHLARTGAEARVEGDVRSPYPRIVHATPAAPPLVSLLIPTRDRASLLETCVESIRERTLYPNWEILVLDNGSEEPATEALFERLSRDPRIRVLPQPGPFNYSRLNNQGAAAARGSILGLVNNDIEVIAPDWLDEMVGYARQDRVGCVGAKLYYPDDTLQHGGVILGLGGAAGHGYKHTGRHEPGYLDRLVTVANVSAVTAACLLVRRSVYEEVGGLDEEQFRVAFNDVDFCLKVARAGYLNIWTPFAELYHHESVSRGADTSFSKARRFASELHELQRRWGLRLIEDPYYSPHLTTESETCRIRTR